MNTPKSVMNTSVITYVNVLNHLILIISVDYLKNRSIAPKSPKNVILSRYDFILFDIVRTMSSEHKWFLH